LGKGGMGREYQVRHRNSEMTAHQGDRVSKLMNVEFKKAILKMCLDYFNVISCGECFLPNPIIELYLKKTDNQSLLIY
jgi:hypothetical protein